MLNKLSTVLLLGTVIMVSPLRAADPPASAETKLRDSLRATMLQLREAQNQRITLEAEKADTEARRVALSEELEALKKKTAENQAESKRAIDDLNLKVEERDREIGTLRVSLDKWKRDHGKITDIANAKEAQRAKLAEKIIALDRIVADQRVKNAEMYRLGIEIIDRYERFGLGDALTAREPFIGTTRVKFQNLIQDYSDKLADARVNPQPSPPAKPETTGRPAAKPGATPKPEAKSKAKAGPSAQS